MKTYKVTVFCETYTDYLVRAEGEDEALELVMEGEYDCIDNVTSKGNDAINVEEFKNGKMNATRKEENDCI